MEEGSSDYTVWTGRPCNSLIQQILKAWACCLGLCESFCTPSETSDQQEGTNGTTEYTGDDPPTVARVRPRRRPQRPRPSEGRGGQIH